MIRFACPGCNATFTVPDDKAGKTSNCSKCKSPFIIPGEAPAPAAIVLDAQPDDDNAPRRRPRREDDDDDQPRRRSRRDDDDDHPRSRSRRDNDDDLPRRRRDRDDDDEDYELRRKPKKKKTSGMILACGIIAIVAALLIGGLAIYDADGLGRLTRTFNVPKQTWDRLPADVRSAVSTMEIAFVFFQIAVYGSLLAAVLYIAAGIGLILHQQFGRIVMTVAMVSSAIILLCLVIFLIMLATVSLPGNQRPPLPTLAILARMPGHIVPLVFGGITIFNPLHTRFLRYKL